MRLEHASKSFTGELMKQLAIRLGEPTTLAKSLVMAALIGVKYLRRAIYLQCLLQAVHAEPAIQRIG